MRTVTGPPSSNLASALAATDVKSAPPQAPIAIDGRVAQFSGIRLRYLIAGKGNPVYLLHGYAQTSHVWRPLIGELAKAHTVIAPTAR